MTRANERDRDYSTWNRTRDEEPVFILVARDKLAPAAVRAWIGIARESGVTEEKLSEAEGLAQSMERWQEVHGNKLPD